MNNLLSVCLNPIDVKMTEILCGTSHDPREGLRMLRISNSCLKKSTQKISLNLNFFFGQREYAQCSQIEPLIYLNIFHLDVWNKVEVDDLKVIKIWSIDGLRLDDQSLSMLVVSNYLSFNFLNKQIHFNQCF